MGVPQGVDENDFNGGVGMLAFGDVGEADNHTAFSQPANRTNAKYLDSSYV